MLLLCFGVCAVHFRTYYGKSWVWRDISIDRLMCLFWVFEVQCCCPERMIRRPEGGWGYRPTCPGRGAASRQEPPEAYRRQQLSKYMCKRAHNVRLSRYVYPPLSRRNQVRTKGKATIAILRGMLIKAYTNATVPTARGVKQNKRKNHPPYTC